MHRISIVTWSGGKVWAWVENEGWGPGNWKESEAAGLTGWSLGTDLIEKNCLEDVCWRWIDDECCEGWRLGWGWEARCICARASASYCECDSGMLRWVVTRSWLAFELVRLYLWGLFQGDDPIMTCILLYPIIQDGAYICHSMLMHVRTLSEHTWRLTTFKNGLYGN